MACWRRRRGADRGRAPAAGPPGPRLSGRVRAARSSAPARRRARSSSGSAIRLDQVVVGAGGQPLDDLLASASASSAAGSPAPGGRRRRAQEPTDFDPADAGHEPVEHHDVGAPDGSRRCSSIAEPSAKHLDPVAASASARRARSASSALSSTTQTTGRESGFPAYLPALAAWRLGVDPEPVKAKRAPFGWPAGALDLSWTRHFGRPCHRPTSLDARTMAEALIVDDSKVMRDMIDRLPAGLRRIWCSRRPPAGSRRSSSCRCKPFDLRGPRPQHAGHRRLSRSSSSSAARTSCARCPILVVTTRGDESSRDAGARRRRHPVHDQAVHARALLGEVRALLDGAARGDARERGLRRRRVPRRLLAEAEEHLAAANANLLAVEQAAHRGSRRRAGARAVPRRCTPSRASSAMVGRRAHRRPRPRDGGGAARRRSRGGPAARRARSSLLLEGVRAIEQRVQALRASASRSRPRPRAARRRWTPLRQTGSAARRPRRRPPRSSPELAAEARRRRARAARAGARRRAAARVLLDFMPSPERAAAGITITTVRERVGALGEIVKVVPLSVPATAEAPGGLAFALLVLDRRGRRRRSPRPPPRRPPRRVTPIGLDATARAPTRRPGVDEDELDERRRCAPRRGFVRVEVGAARRRAGAALGAGRHALPADARAGRRCARRAPTCARCARSSRDNGRQLRDLRAAIMRARMVPVAELLERVPLIVRGLQPRDRQGGAARARRRATPSSTRRSPSASSPPSSTWCATRSTTRIEPPEERRAAGKPAEGAVRVDLPRALRQPARADRHATTARGIDRGRGRAARRARRCPATDDGAARPALRGPGSRRATRSRPPAAAAWAWTSCKRIAVDELGGELSLTTQRRPGHHLHAAGAAHDHHRRRVLVRVRAAQTFVVPVAHGRGDRRDRLAAGARGPIGASPATGAAARRARDRLIERRGEAVPLVALGRAARRSRRARRRAAARRSSCGAAASRSRSRSTACSASRRSWCGRSRIALVKVRGRHRAPPTSATASPRWCSTWSRSAGRLLQRRDVAESSRERCCTCVFKVGDAEYVAARGRRAADGVVHRRDAGARGAAATSRGWSRSAAGSSRWSTCACALRPAADRADARLARRGREAWASARSGCSSTARARS